MTHLPLQTKVKIVNYHPEFNGSTGVVSGRDGEYYQITLDKCLKGSHISKLYDLYQCELEVLDD